MASNASLVIAASRLLVVRDAQHQHTDGIGNRQPHRF